MKKSFNYKEVPSGFLHCFNSECEQSNECLRYQVGLHTTKEVNSFSVVNPKYVAVRKECPYFFADQLTRYALGISHLFDNIPYSKAVVIKKNLIKHFGERNFYRFRSKEWIIDPKAQEYIRKTFMDEGIEEELMFDEYVEHYEWFPEQRSFF
jgi:hypothetical protein